MTNPVSLSNDDVFLVLDALNLDLRHVSSLQRERQVRALVERLTQSLHG